MTKWAIRAGLGLLIVAALIGAGIFIVRGNPFNRPSAAAKIQPKIEKAVARTQAAEVKAVEKAEAKTQTAATVIEKRTATGVTKILQSTARASLAAAAVDVPDAEFYRSVCASKLYAGTEACRGYGGRP